MRYAHGPYIHSFCDLLQCTRMEKCNLYILYNKNSNGLLKYSWSMKKERQIRWRDLTWIWRHLCASFRSRSTNNENAHRSQKSRYYIIIIYYSWAVTSLLQNPRIAFDTYGNRSHNLLQLWNSGKNSTWYQGSYLRNPPRPPCCEKTLAQAGHVSPWRFWHHGTEWRS